MAHFGFLWRQVCRHKYALVVSAGVLVVGFLDENSFLQRINYELQIRDLRAQIGEYAGRYESDSRQLRELARNPKAIEKIARERYFMKADDEDIFVLSDDRRTEPQHETVK